MFSAALFTTTKWEETHMSINRGLDKDASEYGESSMETPPHAEQMANLAVPLRELSRALQQPGGGGAPVYPRLIHAVVKPETYLAAAKQFSFIKNKQI